MNINLAPKTKTPAQPFHGFIDGFEVWRRGRTWHAQKWPCVMSAPTKRAIVEMIRNHES